jgi:alpha-ribazole phosphatase
LEFVKNLFLVRHAETAMAGRFCGHSDPELNERGRQQLARIVNELTGHAIRRIYTSDLRRARDTADAIASHFEIGLEIRPGLREIHFGLWEGLSWSQIETRDPTEAKRWAEQYPAVTAPGGESMQQFERRVRTESAFLFARASECPIAVVAHAGVIRVLLTVFYGTSEEGAWSLTREHGSIVALDVPVSRASAGERLRDG